MSVKLKELHVQNFQSLKDVTIHFSETGAFHIRGKHNIGKSSIVKAINTLFNNVSKFKYGAYLRDNCKTFIITGKFYDGGIVTLSRGEVDFYEWETPKGSGRKESTNGQVPDELVEYFNLYHIFQKNTNKVIETLNVRVPRSKLIFVDTTDSENYLYIQKAIRTEHFISATKLAQSEKREVNSTIKQLTTQQETYQETTDKSKVDYLAKQKEYNHYKALRKTIEEEHLLYVQAQEFLKLANEVTLLVAEIKNIVNVSTTGKTNYVTLDDMEKELDELQQTIVAVETAKEYIDLFESTAKLEKEIAYHNEVVTLFDKEEIELLISNNEKSRAYMALVCDIKEKQTAIVETKKTLLQYRELEELYTECEKAKAYVALSEETDAIEQEVVQTTATLADYAQLEQLYKETQKGKEFYKLHDLVGYVKEQITLNEQLIAQYTELSQVMYLTTKAKEFLPLFDSLQAREKEIASETTVLADEKKLLETYMLENNYCPIVEMTLNKCPFSKV